MENKISNKEYYINYKNNLFDGRSKQCQQRLYLFEIFLQENFGCSINIFKRILKSTYCT